jgi:transcriptional regulator GlxA family with amidase domain
MNRLRVEEAMRLLREQPERSMYDVMLDSGFRTKSSFNREFRAVAGMAPSDYRDGLSR